MGHGPPVLGLKEVMEATHKYNELQYYTKVPSDVLMEHREDVLAKAKEYLTNEQAYFNLLQEYNNIRREIRRNNNRLSIRHT